MTQDLISQAGSLVNAYVIPLGWKLLGAVAIWIVGGWIIRLMGAALGRTLVAQRVDKTLANYIEASASVLMKILVLIAIFGVMGIETTSFAALLAAFGIAIGAAWAGLLSNFAAGLFLMLLRPFKVGDMITAAGVTGDVREIGLFVTGLDTVDNVRVYVGNNKIFSDTIHNYTTNPHRRVDLKAQIAHSVNPQDAIQRLRDHIAKIPNVVTSPAPAVEILEFNPWGTILGVRPYCHNANYWQVYFDTNKVISDTCGEAGFAVPEQRMAVRSLAS
jgi:small conductance mechanosensitive channel